MNTCYLIRPSGDVRPQDGTDGSFIGGTPRLPIDEAIPSCGLCHAEQTFFFQIALPENQLWPRTTVATFACTSCADEEHLIPEMLAGPRRGVGIPEAFLVAYQRNFRFLVFPSHDGVPRAQYVPKIRFQRLELAGISDTSVPCSKLGGAPNWILDDESPGTYGRNVPMRFVLQLEAGLRFHAVHGAPPQMELGLDGRPRHSTRAYYRLFIGNAAYLFGTDDPNLRLVYAITQID